MKHQTSALADQTSDSASMVDGAYQGMRRRILDNIWAPGYQALEQEIAQLLATKPKEFEKMAKKYTAEYAKAP